MSPVWDTAQAVYALGEAGVPRNDPRMLKAVDWMLAKEVRHKGDWAVKVPNTEPGGWYFEFNNEFYPDTDDTAQVLLALSKVDNPRERYQHQVAQRAIEWEFAMQCRNGGWGSFDKDNTKMIFQYIPFADHNAMLDPPSVDITGRMLEMLAAYGYTRDDKRVQKAIKFIFNEQEPDGSWFGRWGVNYIYGTFLVLRGLDAIGVDHLEPQMQQAAEWIRMVQNADGGWGESCGTYDEPDTRGIGISTPSQTAWALLALLAAGDDRSDSIAKGVRWLLERQTRRRKLGRDHGRRAHAPVHHHRHRLPQGVLSGLHHVSPVLPADGANHLQAGHGTRRTRRLRSIEGRTKPVRASLSLAAKMKRMRGFSPGKDLRNRGFRP